MIKMNEDNRNKQIKFERNLITFPYLGFAFIVLLFNIFYTDVKTPHTKKKKTSGKISI